MSRVSQLPALFCESSFDTQIDRLLAETLQSLDGRSSVWKPACNVYDNGDGFYVQVALPGVDVKQIDVQIEDNMLLIKGDRKSARSHERTWHAREFQEGPFACSFRLPSYVDQDKSSALYKQGILAITFPKREGAKPRRIMIEERS